LLTLTREAGQKIVIGDDIIITVVSISENGRVRLGIDAPRQIRIDRSEVLDRIRTENVEAGGSGADAGAWAVYAAKKANRRASGDADAAAPGAAGTEVAGAEVTGAEVTGAEVSGADVADTGTGTADPA
jgi:carbon storage regulator